MQKTLSLGIILFVVATLAIGSFFFANQTETSVEIGVAATSDTLAGAVIPASCGSPHTGDECTPPSFVCDPAEINEGSAVTCEWVCVDSASSSGINFSTGGTASGSEIIIPSETTTYGVRCENGGETYDEVIVYNPNVSITATPTRVRSGEDSEVAWSATGVDSCSVSGPGLSSSETSGSQAVTVTEESTYTLICSTDAGQVTASATVRLVPSFQEF